MDELSPEAEAKDMELVATRAAVRRWECQQAHAGKRTPHRFCSPGKRGYIGGGKP